MSSNYHGERRICICCVLLMLTSLAVVPASSYDSNGVEASEQTLSILPASPTEGGSITGSLTLQNNNAQLAANVEYSFLRKCDFAEHASLDVNSEHSSKLISLTVFGNMGWFGCRREQALGELIPTTMDLRTNSTIHLLSKAYQVCTLSRHR